MASTFRLPNLDDGDPPDVISRHELVRFLAGELAPARRAELEARRAAEPALQARLEEVAADERAADQALRLEVPLPRFLDEHDARRRGARDGLWARLASLRFTLGTSALVAAAAAVFFVVRTPPAPDPQAPAYDGLKGGARVGFFVKDEGGARFGKAGEELAAGDRIQFAVRDDDAHPAMILVGIDGRGEVTLYAAEDTTSARSKGEAANGPRLLPVSVVLDDATGPERFFVVYGDGSVADVKQAVEAAAQELAASGTNLVAGERLAGLPSTWSQSSVHILKVARSRTP